MKHPLRLSFALSIGLLAACSEAPTAPPAVVDTAQPDAAKRAQAAMQDLSQYCSFSLIGLSAFADL